MLKWRVYCQQLLSNTLIEILGNGDENRKQMIVFQSNFSTKQPIQTLVDTKIYFMHCSDLSKMKTTLNILIFHSPPFFVYWSKCDKKTRLEHGFAGFFNIMTSKKLYKLI